MVICEPEKCFGCAACFNICKNKAISMKTGYHGFLYPHIDENQCVNCNLCKKVCIVNHLPSVHSKHKVYAALEKNDIERVKSSSGGIFTTLARKVISGGGVVFGAIIDEKMTVQHYEATDDIGLNKIRESKYVQSEIGDCYQKALNRLKEGKVVLFSGTPCQIAGLRNYIGVDFASLITVDLLCHGVPSPEIFKKYVKSEEEKAGARLKSIQFRSKEIGWKENKTIRIFENGVTASWPDTFVPGFLKDYYLRETCYNCPFSSTERCGDITLGDFWGYSEKKPDYIEDDDKGLSLVMINTPKGEKIFKKIRSSIAFTERTIEEASVGNLVLSQSLHKPDDYLGFWEKAEVVEWDKLCEEYIPYQNPIDNLNKKLRQYYDIPFVKRHRKHKMICKIRYTIDLIKSCKRKIGKLLRGNSHE